MKLELDSLSLEVKRMMLDYPSIFPSRIHCLEFLFCTNGTGYEWQVDGTLKNYDGRDGQTADTPMPEHIQEAEPRDHGQCYSFMEESEAVRLEYEALVRGFREKHIDYLCGTNHTGSSAELPFTSVYPMNWDYCKMGYAADNPHKINDDWREGIREFIHWYLPKVNGYFGCYNDSEFDGPDVDKITDRRTKNNYIICQKVLKIMKTDEDRKQEKRLKRCHRKILHKTTKEMKDDKA